MWPIILVAPDWTKTFEFISMLHRFLLLELATQLDENGKDRVNIFYTKKISPASSDCNANK